MVESLERKTSFNEGSSYFVGDWLVQPVIPAATIAAGVTLKVDLASFANAAFIYLIEIDTEAAAYEFKVWNNAARSGAPVLHLVKDAPLVNYRRLILFVDEDRGAKLHYDLKNTDSVSRNFALTIKAVRQI